MLGSFPPLLQYLLLVFAGWVNRQQLDVIDYLKEENRVLREILGEQRLRFTDAQRRRLAEKAKPLGRKILNDIASIVTPDTLMAWHRKLIAMKWDHTDKRGPGRPRIMSNIAALIVRMASENGSWGYTRIQGALANLGHRVARGTVANILKAKGIDPAPRRGKKNSWEIFLKAHWEVLAATDFFTVEVWTLGGLVTHYVLFFIELATRSVDFAGITTNPNDAFMVQIARNLTDVVDGFLLDKRYLILDRDTKYSQAFRGFLKREGIDVIRLPPRSPNLNAYAERFVRSIKEEMIHRMIFFGEASLRRVLREYMVHYHTERNHQGLHNRLIRPSAVVPLSQGRVHRRKRLGGMLSYYHREAA